MLILHLIPRRIQARKPSTLCHSLCHLKLSMHYSSSRNEAGRNWLKAVGSRIGFKEYRVSTKTKKKTDHLNADSWTECLRESPFKLGLVVYVALLFIPSLQTSISELLCSLRRLAATKGNYSTECLPNLFATRLALPSPILFYSLQARTQSYLLLSALRVASRLTAQKEEFHYHEAKCISAIKLVNSWLCVLMPPFTCSDEMNDERCQEMKAR